MIRLFAVFAFALSCLSSEWWVTGDSVFISITGDSIAEGHNEGTYHSVQHTGPSGNTDASIVHVMAKLTNTGTFIVDNQGKGSQTFDWVDTTGIGACNSAGSSCILILCGVNDVSQGRTWTQVESNLDSIKTKVTNGQKLFVSEILPWTNGNDTQAGTIRTWNANLLTWCQSNGAHLLRVHDDMGKVRAGTGELDDLATAYNYDGVHLTKAGVKRLAWLYLRQISLAYSNSLVVDSITK